MARLANTRDSYNDPVEIYRTAKRRGMDFVTITDHDTIDGCRRLLDRLGPLPDFFVSEEVETWFPETKQRIHVNVFDITEAQHVELQRLRPDIRELASFVRNEGILASVNHMFQNYRMKNHPRRYLGELSRMFQVFEVKNGSMSAHHNRLVADVMELFRKSGGGMAVVGGSDAHNLRSLAKVWTVAPGRTVPEFLASVRAGECFAWGTEMGFADLLVAVYESVGRHFVSVLDFKDPERSAGAKLRHLLVTLATVPVHATGFPAAVTSLNFMKQIFVSRHLNRRLVGELVREMENGAPPSARPFAHAERRGIGRH
jgi:predicted metal-dependent phosphoesterase TrpH